jgi:hypothetical protein
MPITPQSYPRSDGWYEGGKHSRTVSGVDAEAVGSATDLNRVPHTKLITLVKSYTLINEFEDIVAVF